jgi:hypothetical protein
MHTHDAQEHLLEYVISATDDGPKAARTAVDGGPLTTLVKFAHERVATSVSTRGVSGRATACTRG